MTYKINATELTLQPTSGKWIERARISYSGTGHSVYAGVREFQLSWGLVSPAQFNQIINFYNGIGTTGTAVVDLPQFGAATYTFFSYSGCVLHEPTVNQFFSENLLEAVLMITNIRT